MRKSNLAGVRAHWRKQFLASALCTGGFLVGQMLCAGEPQPSAAPPYASPPAAPLTIWNHYAQAREEVAEFEGQRSEIRGRKSEIEVLGFGVQVSGGEQPEVSAPVRALRPAAISVAEDAVEAQLPAIISPREAKPLRRGTPLAATTSTLPPGTATTGRSFAEGATTRRPFVAPQVVENQTLARASAQPLVVENTTLEEQAASPANGGRQPPELEVGGRKSEIGSRSEFDEAPIARIAALPLPLDEASATQQAPRATASAEPRPLVVPVEEDKLAPIVPVSAMPRRVKPRPGTGEVGSGVER